MRVCVCMCVCVCSFVCMCMFVHIYICASPPAYASVWMQVHVLTYICWWTYICTYVSMYIHTYICTHIYYMNIHPRTHTHTHTHIPVFIHDQAASHDSQAQHQGIDPNHVVVHRILHAWMQMYVFWWHKYVFWLCTHDLQRVRPTYRRSRALMRTDAKMQSRSCWNWSSHKYMQHLQEN